MKPLLLLCRENWFASLLALCCTAVVCHTSDAASSAADLSRALQVLGHADAGTASQVEAQRAWRTVTSEGTVEQIPEILAAMRDVGPLADNWLRAAVDTIAEREFRKTGNLPTVLLESFVMEEDQPPRARRIAYEWLAKADVTAPERLLPMMLDDASLEMRHDAISCLLAEAKASGDENVKLKKYQRALRSARERGQLQECAEALQALGKSPNMAQQLGYLTAWNVIGPFDNAQRAGFDKVFPPEQETDLEIDLETEVDGKSGPVEWKEVEAEEENLKQLGYVDLNAALVEEKNVLAYAFTTFFADEEMWVECRYETIEATKLWVNGEEIAAKNVYHSGNDFDQYIVACQLKRGENRILIKVCQNEQTEPWTKPWGFRLRITDKLGGAIQQAK